MAKRKEPERKKSEYAYRCPKCGGTNLGVVQCRVNGDMDLTNMGFIISGDTSEEWVECRDCGKQADIGEFTREG